MTTPSKSECVGYHPNGQLQFRYALLNGEMDGVCQCWHDNGQVGTYEVYVNGKKHGLKREWYPNGILKSELEYCNDLPCNSHKAWYETGQICVEENYTNGILQGLKIKHYSNGILKFTGSFEEGKPVGIQRTWYETGAFCLEESFKKGKLHGARTQWFPNGVKVLITYRNSLKDGIKKIWNDPGTYCYQRLITVRDLLHGRSLYWHPMVSYRMRDQYFKGMRHGVMTTYDETGKLLDKKVFHSGVSISNRLNNLIKSGSLNASHILNENNIEVRRICIEELGYAKFLSQVKHVILDKKDEYELIRIDFTQREEPLCLVKVKCPSTGAFLYFAGSPTMSKVKEAVAWTFGLTPDEYCPQKET